MNRIRYNTAEVIKIIYIEQSVGSGNENAFGFGSIGDIGVRSVSSLGGNSWRAVGSGQPTP